MTGRAFLSWLQRPAIQLVLAGLVPPNIGLVVLSLVGNSVQPRPLPIIL